MNEASGVLRPVVEKYLAGADLEESEIETMKTYLRQWMNGPWVGGEPIVLLRAAVEEIIDTAALRRWFTAALDVGIDPL